LIVSFTSRKKGSMSHPSVPESKPAQAASPKAAGAADGEMTDSDAENTAPEKQTFIESQIPGHLPDEDANHPSHNALTGNGGNAHAQGKVTVVEGIAKPTAKTVKLDTGAEVTNAIAEMPVPGTVATFLHPGPLQEEISPPAAQQGEHDLITLLRHLRANVQDVRDLLVRIQAGTTTVQTEVLYLEKAKSHLTDICTVLRPSMLSNDTLQHICNALEQIINNPLLVSQEEPLSAQVQTNAQLALFDQIQRIEFWIGTITIPSRLNEWLDHSNPGYYVPFHLVFQDEVPSDADRQKILNYLAWSPMVVKNGIVDVTAGLVFRYAEDPKAQRRSLLWLLGAVAASLGIVMLAAFFPIPLSAWSSEQTGVERAFLFTVGWAAVFIGVVTHIGVESLKREQATGLPTVLALSNLSRWIDAKIGQLVWKLVLILIGFFMVIVGLGSNAFVVNAFLAGYSLDSFIGIFGTKVESQVAALQQRVKGNAG
jgi:uncharacterized membrane protein YczE